MPELRDGQRANYDLMMLRGTEVRHNNSENIGISKATVLVILNIKLALVQHPEGSCRYVKASLL